jgi:hypothetical protein
MSDDRKLERALKTFSIGLVVQLVYVVVRMLLLQTMRPSFDLIEKIELLSGLALDLFWVWIWVMLAQATDGEKHKLVRVAALLAGVMTLFGLRAFFVHRGEPASSTTQALYTLSTLLWLSSVPVSWYALLGLWDPARRARPASATAGMWATLVLRAAIVGVHLVPLAVWDSQGFRPWMLFTWLGWISLPLSLVAIGLELWLVNQLRRGTGAELAPGEADGTLTAPLPGNDFVAGTLWLVGGILVTFVSYAAASSGSGGGRYFVTTGAIAYGIGRIIRGFARR